MNVYTYILCILIYYETLIFAHRHTKKIKCVSVLVQITDIT